MKKKRFGQFLLAVIIGLAMVLSDWMPAFAASPDAQTTTDWRGEYYADMDLIGVAALVRSDKTIDFNWGAGAPAPALPVDRFSVRWTRTVIFAEGTYRFRATVDDGVRLFVDGVLVIDEWRDGAQRELAVDRRLSAGPHALRVEYYERGGMAVARVRWEAVSPPVPNVPAWRGEYFSNLDLRGDPILVRNDTAIDFNWGSGAPASVLPADNFSVRWTRTATFEEGTFRFRATVDDGIRLFVDGVLLIDQWRDGAQRELAVDRRLSAGPHTLRVEYYEHGGMAVARVRWEKATPAAPDDPAWKGEYWANLDLSGKPAMVRSDPVLAFDWGQGTPGGTIPSDNFAARWTRNVNFDAGTYRFTVLVDDGIRLRLNDRLILDAWSDHDSARLTTDQTLAKGTYTLRVEYFERIGNARIHVWWEKVAAPSYADWKGEYWANRDLSGEPDLVRNDQAVDFDWGSGAPSSNLPADDFSARWTRQVYLDAGTYRFYTLSDDGVRLWVDGQRAIDKWRDQGPTEHTKEVALTQGSHSLKVEYYDHTGGARVHVWWKKVSAPSYADWKAEYWPNRDLGGKPALVRNDPSVDFDWGTGAAAAGLPKDNFSVRWTRQVTFPRGVYRFYAWADDGIRAYVDGQSVLDEWHNATEEVYSFDLSLDGARRLAVEYYEQGGEARVRFWWKRIGDA